MGMGISFKFGGSIKGVFFCTRNSSVLLIFSFLNTFPAVLKLSHALRKTKIKKIIILINHFFNNISFIKIKITLK